MASPTFHPAASQQHHLDLSGLRLRANVWAIPIGRCLFALIFVLASFNHFTSQMIGYAYTMGVPYANFLVPASGVLALAGGLSVMFGYHARIGALLLLAFLLPVTFTMHNFWAYSNPTAAANQLAQFFKNVSMMGGCLLVCFYGAGPVSIDHRVAAKASQR